MSTENEADKIDKIIAEHCRINDEYVSDFREDMLDDLIEQGLVTLAMVNDHIAKQQP